MARFKMFVIMAALSAIISNASWALNIEKVEYRDSWAKQGISIDKSSRAGMDLTFSLKEFFFEEKDVEGGKAVAVKTAGSLLPIGAGYPDLPVISHYVALPKGATPKVKIISYREEKYSGINIAPCMELPFDTDQEIKPLAKKTEIYDKNEFFPNDFVMQSPLQKMRGMDVFIISFSPFRYNPVTKDLVVRRDMKVEISFDGGTGEFGDDLYRHPLFEGVLRQNIINYGSIQPTKYVELAQATATAKGSEEVEYIIIVPDDPSFIAWADTLKEFRKKQGIKTGIFTITEIGGNTPAMVEAFIDNAYNNWTIKPLGVLMFSDLESTSKAYGLTSSTPIPHPSSYPDYVSDNVFGDVDITDAATTWDNGGAPELVFARMTAQTASQCSIMVKKIINYESHPPSGSSFYSLPLSAAGWQDERWFGMCSEIVRGFLKNKLGKTTQQQYALVDANGPAEGDPWSTTDPSAVVAAYGPSGEGYIAAAVPAGMDWSSGTADGVVSAVNNGCFMIMHRDHGNYYGWGEPAFTRTNILSLTNTDLTFVFSMNCQTGAFQYPDAETFSERFHRIQYGALGVVCATEVSYSFVNDALIIGVMDGLWPNFNTSNNYDIPNAGAGQTYEKYSEDLRPGFALASGKWHLMSQTYTNPVIPLAYKGFTCQLFHLFGDPFMTFCSQIPDTFVLTFYSSIPCGSQAFSVNVKNQSGQNVPGALIGLYMPTNSPEIITSNIADENGNITFSINPQVSGPLYVTATKSNFVRHETYATVNSGTPSKPTLVKLLDGARVPELKPAVSFYSIDSLKNPIDYRVIWDTTANFNSPVKDSITTAAFSSGETVNFIFPVNLVDGRTYWWKVKGRDPSGTNLFGLESDIRSFTIGTELPAGSVSWFHAKGYQFASDNCTGAVTIKADSVILAEPSSGTVVLLNENFDAGTSLPNGWSRNEVYNNEYDWTIGTSASILSQPPNYGTYYAYVSYPSSGPGTTSDADELITPLVSLVNGASGLVLKYGIGYNYAQFGDSLSTWVRFSQGESWQVVSSRTSSQTSATDSINLTGYLPKDSVQVMWRFSSPGGRAGEYVAIDNVLISCDYSLPNTDGSLITSPVVYSSLANSTVTDRVSYGWGKVMWHKKLISDSIGVRIDYLNNNVWAPVPEAVLPGNSEGYWDMNSATDSLSLNGLDTLVYDTLRAVVLMCRPLSKSSANPVLIDIEMGRPGYMAATGVVTSDNDRTTPKIFSLGQAYPNPASGKVSIKYTLSTTGQTSVKVYNILGAEVKTLVNSRQDANAYMVTWDGKDNNGRAVANGVYFYKLVSGEFTATKKMMLLK